MIKGYSVATTLHKYIWLYGLCAHKLAVSCHLGIYPQKLWFSHYIKDLLSLVMYKVLVT